MTTLTDIQLNALNRHVARLDKEAHEFYGQSSSTPALVLLEMFKAVHQKYYVLISEARDPQAPHYARAQETLQQLWHDIHRTKEGREGFAESQRLITD